MAPNMHCKMTLPSGELQRFMLPSGTAETQFKELLQRATTATGVDASSVMLRYKDNEGDMVTMGDASDLEYAEEMLLARRGGTNVEPLRVEASVRKGEKGDKGKKNPPKKQPAGNACSDDGKKVLPEELRTLIKSVPGPQQQPLRRVLRAAFFGGKPAPTTGGSALLSSPSSSEEEEEHNKEQPVATGDASLDSARSKLELPKPLKEVLRQLPKPQRGSIKQKARAALAGGAPAKPKGPLPEAIRGELQQLQMPLKMQLRVQLRKALGYSIPDFELPPGRPHGGHGHGAKLPERKKMAARFVSHVTVPEETIFAPGAAFTKTWQVRNDSQIDWPAGNCELVCVSGEAGDPLFAAPTPVALALKPGETGEVSVPLTAPEMPGLFQSFFRLRGVQGSKFGQRLNVSIIVADGAAVAKKGAEDATAAPVEEQPHHDNDAAANLAGITDEEEDGFHFLAVSTPVPSTTTS